MENLPSYIEILFIVTAIVTVFIFYKASQNSRATLFILLAWMSLQGGIGLSGFYTVTDSIPPRFIFLLFPPFLMIIILFSTQFGRKYIDRLDIKMLTVLHTVRIPVELVLFLLATKKAIPWLMTFGGINFDIIAGLTAPVVFYFCFIRKMSSNRFLLAWNIICLLLLLNIVCIAALSAPFPFQQLAFDQPNVAVLYFPFLWLPGCIVPIVLLSHLAAIRRLLNVPRSKFNV